MENSCTQFINRYLAQLNQHNLCPDISSDFPAVEDVGDKLLLSISTEKHRQVIRILLTEALHHDIHLLIASDLAYETSISIYSEKHQFLLTITPIDEEIGITTKKPISRIMRARIALLKNTRITPIVGPDGSGKTAMLDELNQQSHSSIKRYRFKNLIRHNLLYQISRHWLLKKVEHRIPQNIKKAAVKDYYDDIIGDRIISFGGAYYPFLAIKQFLSRGFLFVDRFFHDFIIQDARFNDRESKLRSNWKNLLKRSPDTYWFLHMDAPNHIILSRKQELNVQAINAYRECMFEMYLYKPSPIYSYINTKMPITHCVETIQKMGNKIGYDL